MENSTVGVETLTPYEVDGELVGYVVCRLNDEILVVADAEADDYLTWQQTLDFAAGLPVPDDGAGPWRVPTRLELSLVREYVAEQLEVTGWQWSSEEYSSTLAWIQVFSGPDAGYQGSDGKSYTYRGARPVRRLPVPLSASAADGADSAEVSA